MVTKNATSNVINGATLQSSEFERRVQMTHEERMADFYSWEADGGLPPDHVWIPLSKEDIRSLEMICTPQSWKKI